VGAPREYRLLFWILFWVFHKLPYVYFLCTSDTLRFFFVIYDINYHKKKVYFPRC
jgi:hypothetical protein